MTLRPDFGTDMGGTQTCCVSVSIEGAVQGVGFRPFVHQLATSLGLKGFVQNTPDGVQLDVEGEREALTLFLVRLPQEKPTNAEILTFEPTVQEHGGYVDFRILDSIDAGDRRALVLPDLATCEACFKEVDDPNNRRYLYPFTNCTHCGPRYSILTRIPYDRHHTSMAGFTMCPECQAEYEDPADRRFHAQPNACPACGPEVTWCDQQGTPLARRQDAMLSAAKALEMGSIVATKGLGGFHLMVDARSSSAVARLRSRKHREEKPLAVMFRNLACVRQECCIDDLEARLLTSTTAPIVLVRKRDPFGLAPNLALATPWLGAMLPSTPLHHILLQEVDAPLVATSGNLVDEPLCIDNEEAVERLSGMADFFLLHNRPIIRPIDDSVVRVMQGREMVLRRARGYAPLPIHLSHAGPSVLAVGAHGKGSIALSRGNQLFLSQHLGDLDTPQARDNFGRVVNDLEHLLDIQPKGVARDMHPDYASTLYAETRPEPAALVQHHFAHLLSCMADNDLEVPVFGLAWDGTGYGGDGTVWGGECMLADTRSFERVGSLRPFPLPGGDIAAREPRRSALGLLFAAQGSSLFDQVDLLLSLGFSRQEIPLLRQALEGSVNSPLTSSIGRLFDAVASLTGLCQVASFEGQAAMALEGAVPQNNPEDAYLLPIVDHEAGPWQLDWQPFLNDLMRDIMQEENISTIAGRFHNGLANAIVAAAQRVDRKHVVLSGGCFQNKILGERSIILLQKNGFQPYWHHRIPPNDGGIAAGQIVAMGTEQGDG